MNYKLSRIVTYYCILLYVIAAIPRTLFSQDLNDEDLIVVAVLDIVPQNVPPDEAAVMTEIS